MKYTDQHGNILEGSPGELADYTVKCNVMRNLAKAPRAPDQDGPTAGATTNSGPVVKDHEGPTARPIRPKAHYTRPKPQYTKRARSGQSNHIVGWMTDMQMPHAIQIAAMLPWLAEGKDFPLESVKEFIQTNLENLTLAVLAGVSIRNTATDGNYIRPLMLGPLNAFLRGLTTEYRKGFIVWPELRRRLFCVAQAQRKNRQPPEVFGRTIYSTVEMANLAYIRFKSANLGKAVEAKAVEAKAVEAKQTDVEMGGGQAEPTEGHLTCSAPLAKRLRDHETHKIKNSTVMATILMRAVWELCKDECTTENQYDLAWEMFLKDKQFFLDVHAAMAKCIGKNTSVPKGPVVRILLQHWNGKIVEFLLLPTVQKQMLSHIRQTGGKRGYSLSENAFFALLEACYQTWLTLLPQPEPAPVGKTS